MDIYQSGIGRIERTVARIIDFLDIFQLAQHLSIAHDSAVDSVSSLDESSADKSLVWLGDCINSDSWLSSKNHAVNLLA